MAKVLIEKYRGVEIFYNTDKDKFEFDLAEGDISIVKINLTTSRKYIDDFLKNNDTFTTFKAFNLNSYGDLPNKEVEVVGRRKDGRFIFKDDKGNVGQISSYDEKYFFYYNKDNDVIFGKIAIILSEIDEARERVKELKKELKLVSINKMSV